MTEFKLAENFKSGLMVNKELQKYFLTKYPHPDQGIPRCELYFYIESIEFEFDNAIEIGAKLIPSD